MGCAWSYLVKQLQVKSIPANKSVRFSSKLAVLFHRKMEKNYSICLLHQGTKKKEHKEHTFIVLMTWFEGRSAVFYDVIKADDILC